MRLLGRAPLIAAGAVLASLAAAGPVAAGGSSLSPAKLYKALLKASVGSSQLPHGYRAPAVGVYKVSGKAKSHHAVGGVQILADGGSEAVIYIVFKTAADAKLDWQSANFSNVATSAAPRSIPKPSVVVNTSATGAGSGGKTLTIGLTDVGCLRGNVIVQAATSSTTSKKHGDVAGAIALERFALAHLAAVR